ncbi:MAG: DUF4255 domain-containing protein [Planctomycetes bacterium]|nr:DUF4255 domain-containing protein [Planctomycetota bacterium]
MLYGEPMRPRIFYELSRYLAISLEGRIRGEGEEGRIPVFLCHPLDVLEERSPQEREKAAGVLYLRQIRPSSDYPRAGIGWDRGGLPPGTTRLRRPGLWVSLRYAFLVVGGTMEEEMGILEEALRALHDQPLLDVRRILREEIEEMGELAEIESLPLVITDEPDVWRELGLEEHRLALSFEIRLPLPSLEEIEAPAILERDLRVEIEDASGPGRAP